MNEMFCYQCEQTAHGSGCTMKAGICGKTADVAALQDQLTEAMITLARIVCKKSAPVRDCTIDLIIKGLFTTITNVNFNAPVIQERIAEIKKEIACYSVEFPDPPFTMKCLWESEDDIRSLKALLLFGLRGMAAYAYHAKMLDYTNKQVDSYFIEGLSLIGTETTSDKLLAAVMILGQRNLTCTEILDCANTDHFGIPSPAEVSTTIKKGPFIVVTGHDYHDLHLLLQQSLGTGIQIYTHGEMLPAHSYPRLRGYMHLQGHFGTAWQNQQREFHNLPAPILFTTNCLMPPRASYLQNVFTSGVVSYPDTTHIGDDKDFTPIIKKALELGGYSTDIKFTGSNGGNTIWTGYSHQFLQQKLILITKYIQNGSIRRIYLVGGCDGARADRSYYTEFVKQLPTDTLILTLACGKYRLNDLYLGKINDLPRLLDMGQCNDTYGAIQLVLALAESLDCSVNKLPLSIVLSWYEQKAVCILLTLLSLGIHNILLGPTLPAFLSSNVLDLLQKKYHIDLISDPQTDIKKCQD